MGHLDVQTVDLDTLSPHPRNPNNGDVDAIADSITSNGLYKPLVVQRSTGYILAGNHTAAALMSLGHTTAPAVLLDVDDQAALRILLADNRIADLAVLDDGLLAELLAELAGDYTGTGYNDDDVKTLTDALTRAEHTPLGDGPSLADRFLVPPFSVIDARQGWWRDRKREWINLGIRSEIGRDTSPFGDHDGAEGLKNNMHAAPKRTLAQGQRQPDGTLGYTEMDDTAAVSIFDPVLCEVIYRWYCPPAGRVLDPYAGGSVRGIVAARLGLDYTGIDLRPEQTAANAEQRDTLLTPDQAQHVRWHTGDSGQIVPTLPTGYDLAFTCPPYFDLKTYSDDPRDLSSMDTRAFTHTYTQHLDAVYGALTDDAWCVYIVGSARDSKGRLRDLRAITYHAAELAGFHLLSDAVLITPAGSLPVRAGRQFTQTRVLGRTHQDILVFWKGNRKNAAARLGTVDTTDALTGITPEEN